MFFDNELDKFKCKSVYGYGFIVNYIESERSENSISLISESIDACPPDFKDIQLILQFIKKSDDKFVISLKMGKTLESMNVFWEAAYNKL